MMFPHCLLYYALMAIVDSYVHLLNVATFFESELCRLKSPSRKAVKNTK